MICYAWDVICFRVTDDVRSDVIDEDLVRRAALHPRQRFENYANNLMREAFIFAMRPIYEHCVMCLIAMNILIFYLKYLSHGIILPFLIYKSTLSYECSL